MSEEKVTNQEFRKAVETIYRESGYNLEQTLYDFCQAYLRAEEDDEGVPSPFDDLLPEDSGLLEWQSYMADLYRIRVPKVFTEDNGWIRARENADLTAVVKDDLDGDGEEVAVYPDDEMLFFFHKERGIRVCIEENYSSMMPFFRIAIEGHVGVEDKVWVTNLIEQPNPYRGKVCATNGRRVKVIKLKTEPLQPYPQKVENDVDWFTSVADPEVQNALHNAGLPVKSGMLLQGPPGSGKTSLTRRIAADLTSAPDSPVTVLFVDPVSDVEGVFAQADLFEATLVVFEDVESFAGERGEGSFTEFLNCLDGVEDSSNIMVLATTNDATRLDPAVVRPGRLERSTTIDGVYESFLPSVIAEKFPGATNQEVDAIASAMRDKTEPGHPSPAQVDYLARTAIMSRMSPSELVEWVHTEWNPKEDDRESYIL